MEYKSPCDIHSEINEEATEVFKLRQITGDAAKRREIAELFFSYRDLSNYFWESDDLPEAKGEKAIKELIILRERLAKLKATPEPSLDNKEISRLTKNPAPAARDFLV